MPTIDFYMEAAVLPAPHNHASKPDSSDYDVAPPVIAMVGPSGSGKTTAARAVWKNARYDLYSFGTGPKVMLGALYAYMGLDFDEIRAKLHGAAKDQPCDHLGGKTPRHALQTLGTDWGREQIDPDLWVDALDRHIGGLKREKDMAGALVIGEKVVIDDVRFENEASFVLDHYGHLVRPVGLADEGRDGHVSEHAWANIPATTFNVRAEDLAAEIFARIATAEQAEDRVASFGEQ